MSWFGSNPFDEVIERATSELLPAGQEDWAQNLEICDQVRSKQVQPKDAARALRKRLAHKNPNVQLLALKLTDTVVKNGGHHFLVQVASREFTDDIVSIIRQPATNAEVKSKALCFLQAWASAFQGKSELSYVEAMVRTLKADHFVFPEGEMGASAAMVDTAAAPDWTDSDVCMRCRTAFTITNRKHHCRQCGQTFCGTCSSKNLSLPQFGINQAVRVCDGCYAKDWAKRNLTGEASLDALSNSGQNESHLPKAPINTSEDEDADLKKAIEASLKESGGATKSHTAAGDSDRGASFKIAVSQPVKTPAQEEDDPDLAAAISASLQEVNIGRSKSSYPSYTSASTTSYDAPASKTPDAGGISSMEKENIGMFASVIARINETNGNIAGDRQVQALYEQIGSLQPRLLRSLEKANSKHQQLNDLHEQITRAVKTYDSLLEQRLADASSYGRSAAYLSRSSSSYHTQPPQEHSYLAVAAGTSASGMYPSSYPESTSAAVAPSPYSSSGTQYHQPASHPVSTSAGYPQPYQSPQQDPPPAQQQYSKDHQAGTPYAHGAPPADSQRYASNSGSLPPHERGHHGQQQYAYSPSTTYAPYPPRGQSSAERPEQYANPHHNPADYGGNVSQAPPPNPAYASHTAQDHPPHQAPQPEPPKDETPLIEF